MNARAVLPAVEQGTTVAVMNHASPGNDFAASQPTHAAPSNAPVYSQVPQQEPARRSARPSDLEDAGRAALLAELRQTIDKLERDRASRGDLKILSRALRELRYAFKVFSPYRRNKKVTVFGSARTPPEHPDYQLSVQFGRRMANAGWMVITGAGGGIMEGAHVGAGQAMAMGVNILLPFEQEANYIISKDEKLVTFRYFFTRKLMFVKETHAVALFPGGFGTQDELFETLTLLQTGKRDLLPVVCIDHSGGTYWKTWYDYVRQELLGRRLISPEDLSLFKITDDLDNAISEILHFYAVYDSMRYVQDRLVIRLKYPPSQELLDRLNVEFADLLTSGKIERVPTHPFEYDDDHVRHLPRIALRFNRRSPGRLRQMIDVLNREISTQAEQQQE
ncbi:MAG: Rossman fold protein, TIGR00730 family [Planctomycetaceae bacterium]|nr:MAG: Rossman fold protein, TIGR00730 family [Planctomycetaceae bacterium]